MEKEIVKLKGLEGTGEYDYGIVSLPLPDEADIHVEVEGSICQTVPVGFWPRSEETPGGPRIPRRMLVFFTKPELYPVVPDVLLSKKVSASAPNPNLPAVEVRDLESIAEGGTEEWDSYYKTTCELVLRHEGKETGVRLAYENDTGTHLWQYVVAEKLWEGPLCAGWRVGGHIYTEDESRHRKDRDRIKGRQDDIYRDHTLQASVYLIVFADGTVSLTGHWINGRIYGGTGPTQGVPVVYFRGAGALKDGDERSWNGTDAVFPGETAALDLSDAADLVSPDHPGRISRDGDLLRWQPVENTNIVIRSLPKENGEGVVWTEVGGSKEGLVEGAGRSVRWTVNLAGRATKIQRFLAPREWYGRCAEFTPFPVEKTPDGEWSELSRRATDVILRNAVSGSFTSGGIFRYLDQHGIGCYEISFDANEARSLFRRAYWDHDPEVYDLALRNAYICADLGMDHSRDIVHYHGDPGDWRIYSLIYMRFSGYVHGYLETGDPYLLESAKAIARNYASHHMLNWPRRGIGRDADPLTGINLLYDFTGDEHYHDFAREFAGHVAKVIFQENGKWHCGSGVGPAMGVNAAIGDSWNGGHLTSGFTEWLMRADENGDPVPEEWLEKASMALDWIFETIERRERSFHPASTGFVGRIHWYLACRLGDKGLIERARQLLKNIHEYDRHPVREPLFTGGWAHHMNNYVDNLLFYQCTEETLPDRLREKFS
jgi:hypothetical protein